MTTVQFTGWNEFREKVKKLPDVVFDEIDGEIEDVMGEWEALAKGSAPVDQFTLRSNIGRKQVSLMHWDLISGSETSAVTEWGTGSRVKVPAGLQSYAAQFKGLPSGGTADQALTNLEGWVKRKGIRFESAAKFKSGERKGQNKKLTIEQTAFLIYTSIMRHGVKPHPYFFIHIPVVQKKLDEGVKTILGREH